MSETNNAPITIADDQAAQLSTRRSADGERAILRILSDRFAKNAVAAAEDADSSASVENRWHSHGRAYVWQAAADHCREALRNLIASGAPSAGADGDDIR